MPRNRRYQFSEPKWHTQDEPFKDDAGAPLPCRRCGGVEPPLRGIEKTALVLDNRRELEGRSRRWAIQQTMGEDGDPTSAFKEVTLVRQNYHRECDNALARAYRRSRSTRMTARVERIEELLSKLIAQRSTPAATPATPPPHSPPTPVATPQRRQQRSHLDWFNDPPPLPPSIQSRMVEGGRDIKDILNDLERMEQEARLAKERLAESASEAEEDSAPPDDPENDYR
jgi:hypothetical protein